LTVIPQDVITAARDGLFKFSVPASVSIAQWAVESEWGKHSPGNNPFGMKPRKGRNDPQQMLMTTEFIKGKKVRIPQPFREFSSIVEAFDAHAELIATAPVYAPAMAALPDRKPIHRQDG
jgi:flagellum-specific peptidoglycan hydrolase FlgJ